MSQESGQSRHNRGSKVAAFIFGQVIWTTVCLSVFPFLWTQEYFRRDLCGSSFGKNIEKFCPLEDRQVSIEDATKYVDGLVNALQGTQRADSNLDQYTFFSAPDYQTTFVNDWNWTIFTRRTSKVSHVDAVYNQFSFSTRRFLVNDPEYQVTDRDYQANHDLPLFYETPRLWLYEDTFTVTLTMTNEGLKATFLKWNRDDHSGLGRIPQRKTEAVTSTDNYYAMRETSDGRNNINRGDRVYEICQMKAKDGTWWARTYLGWTPHADLAGEDGQVDGLVRCDQGT